MKTATLKIDGMHCGGCARIIESLVSAEPGVRKVSVSFESRDARILFDPEIASEIQLEVIIRNAGYAVVRETS